MGLKKKGGNSACTLKAAVWWNGSYLTENIILMDLYGCMCFTNSGECK